MAFTTSQGTSNQDKTGGTSWAPSFGLISVPAGQLVVICIAADNIGTTTDGDKGDITGISDSVGNVYTKAKEFTNVQGGAAAGVTASIWYCILTNAATNTDTITISFNGTVAARAAAWRAFSFGGGNTIALEGAGGSLANDGADAGNITLSSLTSRSEYLFIRCTAIETNTLTGAATSTNFTTMGLSAVGLTTIGGGSTANMGIMGEYRINSAPGSSESTDPNTAQTADCASVMVAFYESAPAAPIPNKTLVYSQAVKRSNYY